MANSLGSVDFLWRLNQYIKYLDLRVEYISDERKQIISSLHSSGIIPDNLRKIKKQDLVRFLYMIKHSIIEEIEISTKSITKNTKWKTQVTWECPTAGIKVEKHVFSDDWQSATLNNWKPLESCVENASRSIDRTKTITEIRSVRTSNPNLGFCSDDPKTTINSCETVIPKSDIPPLSIWVDISMNTLQKEERIKEHESVGFKKEVIARGNQLYYHYSIDSGKKTVKVHEPIHKNEIKKIRKNTSVIQSDHVIRVRSKIKKFNSSLDLKWLLTVIESIPKYLGKEVIGNAFRKSLKTTR